MRGSPPRRLNGCRPRGAAATGTVALPPLLQSPSFSNRPRLAGPCSARAPGTMPRAARPGPNRRSRQARRSRKTPRVAPPPFRSPARSRSKRSRSKLSPLCAKSAKPITEIFARFLRCDSANEAMRAGKRHCVYDGGALGSQFTLGLIFMGWYIITPCWARRRPSGTRPASTSCECSRPVGTTELSRPWPRWRRPCRSPAPRPPQARPAWPWSG